MNRYAQAGVSFDDYSKSMHTQFHQPAVARRVEYLWALSDTTVRKVVAARIAVIACARMIPDTLEALRALDTLAVDRLSRNKVKNNRMCANAARRVGGLAPYLAALIYRAIRLGEDSVELATELQVTPCGIRQTLYRLNQTAQQLAAGTFHLYKPQRYPRRGGKCGPKPRWDFKAAIPLREAGLSYAEIGAKFGVNAETIRGRFLDAGLRFPRSRRCRPAPRPGRTSAGPGLCPIAGLRLSSDPRTVHALDFAPAQPVAPEQSGSTVPLVQGPRITGLLWLWSKTDP